MSEYSKQAILKDNRFSGIDPFEKRVLLASPTMHGEELAFVTEAIESNWVSTVGKNIDELEKSIAEYLGMEYSVGLSCGTAALHLCVKLAAGKCYPGSAPGNSLLGRRVFCSDMTFDASVNPVVYEGGEPVFIDTSRSDWNMDPIALEEAFQLYPDVKIVILAHLYGVPAEMDEIKRICDEHSALLIEDAAEALGAEYNGQAVQGKAGSFGDYVAISFNGNKVITGSSGGAFLSNSPADAEKIRKWSTQSREAAPWYQHEELGYNYRMSNVVAGVVRGNLLHLGEHISKKKEIYERYRTGLADLPVRMNPVGSCSIPNYWLSCLLINPDAMCEQVRGEKGYLYKSSAGKSCPQEILDVLSSFNAEGRPIWKPMHLQPLYRMSPFVTEEGNGRAQTNAYIVGSVVDGGADIFSRGLCLPSDIKMTESEQDTIIDLIHRCFK